jgi:hypothetical protein
MNCQPHDPYFVWQIEVQITNFRKFGISDKLQVVVWYPDVSVQKEKKQKEEPFQKALWEELERKYPEVSFFYYEDSILDIGLYIPVLRPRTLAKHFDKYPELSKENVFYHDSDIIFNYLPDFPLLCEDAINWQSNTSGYLDYDYLERKEKEGNIPDNEAIKKLCSIGNISVDTLKSYRDKTGGAQCLLKQVDGDFWRDVERQVMEIRNSFAYSQPNSINKRYFSSEDKGFQSWCADMWALNFALWSRGKQTDVTPVLDFSWATDSYETFLKKPIYHNAGATNNTPDLFYKGAWINTSPIGKTLQVKTGTASEQYVKAIQEINV